MTEIGVIGLFRIEPTLDSIIQAARYHEYSFLLDEKGEYSFEKKVVFAINELLKSELTDEIIEKSKEIKDTLRRSAFNEIALAKSKIKEKKQSE